MALKCPYLFVVRQETQTTCASDEDENNLQGTILVETQMPVDCLMESCAMWQGGICVRRA